MAKKGYRKGDVLYRNINAGVAVFLGIAESNGRQVVIKEQTYPTLEAANYSLAEAMNQARLDHPHIVQLYDTRITQGNGFICSIVMEYLQCGDLFKEIQRRSPSQEYWTEDEVLSHMRDLSDALAYAQSRDVAHRDLKPQNIFIREDGRLKIGDFGSSSNGVMSDISTTVLGSPYYLSPELKSMYLKLMGGSAHAYDPYKSDIFSLAVTILFMETLEIDQKIGNSQNPLEPVIFTVEQLTKHPRVQECLRMMVRENPAERVTFAELKAHIDALLASHPCSVCRNPVQPQWEKYCREMNLALVCSESCLSKLPRQQSPQCCVCNGAVSQPFQLPTEYAQCCYYFQQFFQQLCSQRCFQAMYQQHSQLCVGCQCEQQACIQGGSAMRLACGHCFHSQKCLDDYMAQWTAPQICQYCGREIQLNDGSGECEGMIEGNCSRCNNHAQVMMFFCGHTYCYTCGNQTNWMCSDCSSK